MADRFKVSTFDAALLDRDRRRADDLGARATSIHSLQQPEMTTPMESGSISAK
jgi:hypothetical protein